MESPLNATSTATAQPSSSTEIHMPPTGTLLPSSQRQPRIGIPSRCRPGCCDRCFEMPPALPSYSVSLVESKKSSDWGRYLFPASQPDQPHNADWQHPEPSTVSPDQGQGHGVPSNIVGTLTLPREESMYCSHLHDALAMKWFSFTCLLSQTDGWLTCSP